MAGKPKAPSSSYLLWMVEEGRKKIQEKRAEVEAKDSQESRNKARRGAAADSILLKEMCAKIDSGTQEKYKTGSWEDWQKYKVEYREWFEKGGEAVVEQAKKEAEERNPDDGISFTRRTRDLVYFGRKAKI